MKYLALVLLCIVAAVECSHLFFGTNVQRPLVFHKQAQYSSEVFRKRVENLYITVPPLANGMQRMIQGVMAYDMTNTAASANVTQGGLGHNFVNIRMKSDVGKKLDYDVYIYA